MKLSYDTEDNLRLPAFYLVNKTILFLERKYSALPEYEKACVVKYIRNKICVVPVDEAQSTILELREQELISCQEVTRDKFPEYYL